MITFCWNFIGILPEALQTNCQRCSEKQAAIALRVIKRLRKEYPKIWSQLIAKWDPDDVYVKKFESSFGSKTATSKPCQDPNNNKQHTPILQDRNSTTITQLKPISITNKIITSTNLSLHNISNKTISIDQTIGTTQNPSIISSTITTTTGKTIITTKLPTIPGLIPLNTFFTNPPIPIRPIGVNIRATVSGLVRSLGAIGSRVMETGAEIAEVVIKNIVKPLPV
ncbi:hypothetical protein ABEB36_009386 [Hypothenemus hampei]|uniref:Uncharacterized protein n=1 Tax=Hypothenemus hampei TaxID=57062 RepID=A0ABD1EGF3_HYPHA